MPTTMLKIESPHGHPARGAVALPQEPEQHAVGDHVEQVEELVEVELVVALDERGEIEHREDDVEDEEHLQHAHEAELAGVEAVLVLVAVGTERRAFRDVLATEADAVGEVDAEGGEDERQDADRDGGRVEARRRGEGEQVARGEQEAEGRDDHERHDLARVLGTASSQDADDYIDDADEDEQGSEHAEQHRRGGELRSVEVRVKAVGGGQLEVDLERRPRRDLRHEVGGQSDQHACEHEHHDAEGDGDPGQDGKRFSPG